jgi:hypothetical protein
MNVPNEMKPISDERKLIVQQISHEMKPIDVNEKLIGENEKLIDWHSKSQ